MIAAGMLRRQAWYNDDEFDDIVKNSQRVLGLSMQYENHRHVEEFTKRCNVAFVYGAYVLEGEADAKFSLDKIYGIEAGIYFRKILDQTTSFAGKQ